MCDCHSTCGTCSFDNVDRTTCSACVSTSIGYIVGHECLEGVVCPPGKFTDKSSQTCVASCGVKIGNDLTRECVDFCPIGTLKYLTSKCLLRCPSNYFKEQLLTAVTNPLETRFYCKQCGSTCKNCLNQTECIECADGLFLHENTGLCKSTCQTGFTYIDKQQGFCQKVLISNDTILQLKELLTV